MNAKKNPVERTCEFGKQNNMMSQSSLSWFSTQKRFLRGISYSCRVDDLSDEDPFFPADMSELWSVQIVCPDEYLTELIYQPKTFFNLF